jgi:hypothetical protein
VIAKLATTVLKEESEMKEAEISGEVKLLYVPKDD